MSVLRGSYATLADAFDAAVEQFGERVAYVDGYQRLTFAEWHRASDALAGALVERGVRPGDVVAIMLPASIDFAIAFGAIALAGGVATGINSRLGAREVRSILDRARSAAVVLDAASFAAGPPDGAAIVTRDELPVLCAGAPLGNSRPRRVSDDAAVIIWTSGTTGMPKGAWFDHHNMHAAVASAGVMSHPNDVKLLSTPFAHAGYMAKLWDQLGWATTLVIAPTPWRATDMLRLLVDERVTVAGGVPTQWAKLLDEPGIADADLSHMRLGLAATAPADPDLIARVATTIGCPLVVRYAMTESPSITGTEPDDPPDVQYRTVGRPQTGIEIEVVGDDGAPVAPGDIGRVRVRGTCVMRGYWNDPDTTAEVLAPDGWLTSSDLGRLTPDGNLVLLGRAGDMYIRGGYNVHPMEVEHVLAEHPAVDGVAVVGVPTPVIGEIGVAFVTPTADRDPPTLADLRVWVTDRLADYKAPDELVLVDALPLTAMMKIDKVGLRERAARKETR